MGDCRQITTIYWSNLIRAQHLKHNQDFPRISPDEKKTVIQIMLETGFVH